MLPSVERARRKPYLSRRLLATVENANVTHTVNTTTYIATGVLQFYHDWDAFPATHFLITCFGQSSEAAETVSFQLAESATPTTAYSAGGNDLVVTNTNGNFSSGWVAVAAAHTGLLLMVVARKGSTSTVDWSGRWLDVTLKVDPA